MGIFNKVFVPTLASILLCATILPSVGSAEQLTESEENQIQTEVIQTDRGEATITTNFKDDAHRITTVVPIGCTP